MSKTYAIKYIGTLNMDIFKIIQFKKNDFF